MENPERMDVGSTTLYPRCLGNKLRGLNEPVTVVGHIKAVDQHNHTIDLEHDQQSTMYIYSAKQSLKVLVPQSEDIKDFTEIVFMEVRAIHTGDKEITMKSYTDFKENFGNLTYKADLTTYNEMLKLATNQFRSIFNY